jgi:hypothetical protein
VWVASLLFIAVCWLWLPLPGIVWEVEGAARFILIFLQIGGITFSVYSAAAIDIWELAASGSSIPNSQLPIPNHSQCPTPKRSSSSRRQDLRLVRHPIYLDGFDRLRSREQ